MHAFILYQELVKVYCVIKNKVWNKVKYSKNKVKENKVLHVFFNSWGILGQAISIFNINRNYI